MNSRQKQHNHELTIPLEAGQTVLVLSPRDIINTLIAKLIVGYYAGEDVAGGAPYKIALQPSLNTLFEVSLTENQFSAMIRHLASWFKRKRYKIPHAISDKS